jgi:molybdopterin biosynthesis enzyme MoaB
MRRLMQRELSGFSHRYLVYFAQVIVSVAVLRRSSCGSARDAMIEMLLFASNTM